MSQEALDRLLKDLKENGTLIIDGSNVTKVPESKAAVYRFPITETAKKTFGEAMYANMVMLGAFVKITKLITIQSMEKTIRENVSARTVETNINAFRRGLQF
jgi:2-oxoglutarate ferredoxin oxidoreductase subunit gamma